MRIVCWNIIPYFFHKLGKMSQNLSSAAVVIGALRVYDKVWIILLSWQWVGIYNDLHFFGWRTWYTWSRWMDFRESGTGLGFIHASGFRRINFLLLFCGGGYKEYLQHTCGYISFKKWIKCKASNKYLKCKQLLGAQNCIKAMFLTISLLAATFVVCW